MTVRAIRGAIQLDEDSRDELFTRTRELVKSVIESNGLSNDQLISFFFTCTPDLTSDFPAAAARELGLGNVPLMCAVEIDVSHALPRVVRLMAHVDVEGPREQIHHVYLRGATALRTDLAQ